VRPLLVLLALSGCGIVVPPVAREANDRCAALISAGQLDEADAACDLSLEYQPRYWDALHNKGLIAQVRGDRGRAKEFFIKAMRANEHMKSSLNSLAALEMEDGNLAAAERYFKQALVVDPRYPEARRNLGAVYLKRSAWPEAAAEFRKLVLTHPDLVEAHLGLASALLAQGQAEEACAVLERASALDVGDDRAWSMRAACEKKRGRLDEMKEALERCLLANEKNLECQQALESIGD
jgi:tetratricopeptide (TPR) repeat protein